MSSFLPANRTISPQPLILLLSCRASSCFQRYGASLRKQIKKMEITQHARYTCTFCGKVCPNAPTPPLFEHRADMPLLLIGHCEANSCWYLGMQVLPQDHCWWCLDSINDCCCHCTKVSFSCSYTLLSVADDLLSFSTVRRLAELREA